MPPGILYRLWVDKDPGIVAWLELYCEADEDVSVMIENDAYAAYQDVV